MHSIYRERFSSVDIFNKLSLGPNSVQKAYKTQDWRARMFQACMAFCETNAYLAYKMRREREGKRVVPHREWLEDLAWEMLTGDTVGPRPKRARTEAVQVTPESRVGLRHTKLVRNDSRSNPTCQVCKSKGTSYRCKDCNIRVCWAWNDRSCHLRHMLQHVGVPEWSVARRECGVDMSESDEDE